MIYRLNRVNSVNHRPGYAAKGVSQPYFVYGTLLRGTQSNKIVAEFLDFQTFKYGADTVFV